MQLAADHNLDGRIVIGLLRRIPGLNLVHIRDFGLADAPDPVVLQWAATMDRVLLTHDRATLVGFAFERVARGEPMTGVIAVSAQCQIGRAVTDLELLLECTAEAEWPGRVHFIPF